jgi:hypothetical protein
VRPLLTLADLTLVLPELLPVSLTPPYALSACRSNSIGLRYPNVECRRRGL